MATKLYVGNLSFDTTENDLQDLFSEAGTVREAVLIQDKMTGKSRGFAFVTMFDQPEEAQNATQRLNGKALHGRNLTVESNAARARILPAAAVVGAARVSAAVAIAADAHAAFDGIFKGKLLNIKFSDAGSLQSPIAGVLGRGFSRTAWVFHSKDSPVR